MSINKFERLNKINGFIIFLVALTTYYLTVEPTASAGIAQNTFQPLQLLGRLPARVHFFK